MARIAIFSTYAPSEEFGGPARVFHERRALELAGHAVTHVVVDAGGPRGALRRTDMRVTVHPDREQPVDPIYHDVDLGTSAASDASLIERVVEHVRAFRSTHVLLEQPFLIELVRAVVTAVPVPVVYSSQNIEFALRRSLEPFSALRSRPSGRHEQVRALEQLAADVATDVTVICPQDATRMRAEFGCDSTVIANGSAIADLPRPAGRRTTGPGPRHFGFAGSAYWPNIHGLRAIADPSLAFLPPDVHIEVAGTVSRSIQDDAILARRHGANFSRLRLNGFVQMAELVAMLRSSVAVLVPVFLGEGSNLKTADALASGAPVIMTSRSAHGYEDVLELDPEGVTIVDNPSDFRTAMREHLASPTNDAWVGARRREALSWTHRLAGLASVVEAAG